MTRHLPALPLNQSCNSSSDSSGIIPFLSIRTGDRVPQALERLASLRLRNRLP
jgi:hypothetical protein